MNLSQFGLLLIGVALAAGAGSVDAAPLMFADRSMQIALVVGGLVVLVLGRIVYGMMAHRRRRRSTIARRLVPR